MKKSLDTILNERGLKWRQHCGLTPPWGGREPSVFDLSDDELKLCRKNPKAYGEKLWKNGDMLFPATDFSAPYPLPEAKLEKGFIASVPEGHTFYAGLAKKMGGKVIPDTAELPPDKPAVIFGSSAENKHALQLALLQRVMANGVFPGKGGWSLEFPYGKVLRCVVCCDETSVKAFLKHWEGERTPCSVPGPNVPAIYHDPEKVLKTQVCHPGFTIGSFEEFIKVTSEAFDSGGPTVGRDNGHVTVPAIVKSYYAWFYTGDRRFLVAFKELFFALIHYYLTLPGGSSYVSDYDFYLGSLLNSFAAVERDPLFSEEDRLLGASFLLTSFRWIEKFGKSYWPLKPCSLRFNHETFPAVNCYWAALYFGENYNLKNDAARWKYYAKTAFEGGELSRTWRQCENSAEYQWIAPAHKLQWDLAEKGKLSPGFKKITEAIECICDNDGRQIEYGDCQAMRSVGYKDMIQVLAQIAQDPIAKRLSAQLDALNTSYLPMPGWAFHLHVPYALPEEKRKSGWMMLPLVSHILKRFPEAKKSKYDKVTYRDDKRYFLFEPCSCDSHRHNDTGAILCYQQGKHRWLVDNGYGYDARNTSTYMTKAFANREIGPHCHNTIIFRDKDGKAVPQPEFSTFSRRGDTLHCQVEMPGVLWYRQIKLLANGIQVIDEVTSTGETDIATAECQFNALGTSRLKKNVWELKQKENGLAELRFEDSCKCKVFEDSYLTKSWKAAFEKCYFLAGDDVKQLRRIASLDGKEKLIFNSVFTVAES